MRIISFDIESTISNKGNPFDTTNRMVSVAWTDGDTSHCTTADNLEPFILAIQSADLLVGFNIKFDINWLRRYGVVFGNTRVWDCQLAEYIIRRQRTKFPSLNGCLETYDLGAKLDIVKEEYWKKGIDTDQIPWEILARYNIVDVEQTLALYNKQVEITSPIQKRLIQLCCSDLLTLQEMEFNGFPVDLELCQQRSDELVAEINAITTKLNERYPHVPINFNSTDHLSAYMYGGSILEERREIAGLFKTGNKVGQPRYKVNRITHELPGLFKPPEGSELLKEGMYSTGEAVLKKIKDKSGTIDLLLRLAVVTKVNEFFVGFIAINRDMHWPTNKIHGQFNQVSTWTGRLSSTKPNLQNMPPEIQDCVRSEYGKAERITN
jgi:DNA polymerase-1